MNGATCSRIAFRQSPFANRVNAHLLTIGDEILIGQTADTNAAWLGEQLALMGMDVTGAQTVRDTPAAIRRGLERGFEEAELVLTTGGLGPTHDDLTKKVVADFFGVALEQNDEIVERIERYYDQTDRDVPAGFDLLDNPVGTAPGLFYEEKESGRKLVVLPGVPQEMKRIMEASGLPRLRSGGGASSELGTVAHRTLRTTGIVESSLQEKIGDVAADLPGGQSLAYLPSTSGVRLRLTAHSDDGKADAQKKLDALEEHMRARIGKYVYGTGEDELEAVVGGLLAERGWTVALAESATGGTESTPVGTVCIGCATEGGTRAVRLRFTQDRRLNKELFSTALIETLRREVLGIEDATFVRRAE